MEPGLWTKPFLVVFLREMALGFLDLVESVVDKVFLLFVPEEVPLGPEGRTALLEVVLVTGGEVGVVLRLSKSPGPLMERVGGRA